VVPVPGDEDRANLIAYFEALGNGTFVDASPAPRGGGGSGAPPEPISQDNADWRTDKPGRVHRVDLHTLPAPYATEGVVNFPRLVPTPADAELLVPDGFKVDVFSSDVEAPRVMIVAANGDVLLAETQRGRIKVLRPSADGTAAAQVEI